MIQSVERACTLLKIMDQLDDPVEGIGVQALSKIAGLKFPTTHHIVKTLVNGGYIEQNKENGKYRLGKTAIELGRGISNRKELATIAEPFIIALRDKLTETVVLRIYENGRRRLLIFAPSLQRLQALPSVHIDKRIYDSVTGRVMLSNMDESTLQEFVNTYGFPGPLWKNITTLEGLQGECTKIQKKGYAVTRQNYVAAVGVPLKMPERSCNAALAVILPEVRYVPSSRDHIISEAKKTAAIILEHWE